MNSKSSMLVVCLTIAFFAQGTVAQYPDGKTFKPGYCNICGDVPNQNIADPVDFRTLASPNKSFKMEGEDWTCQYLQDTVQDVNPYNGGAEGEARWCSLAQVFGESECDCNGPAAISSSVKQINPACDLCQGQQIGYVPEVNSAITAETGVAGSMNCAGLYNAMAEGVLTSNLCPVVIANAGPKCCSISPDKFIDIPKDPEEPTCAGPTHWCVIDGDCCPGLKCKRAFKLESSTNKYVAWNSCSPSRKRNRQSIAGSGVGGAAARRRAGN